MQETDIRGYCEDCRRWFDISLRAILDTSYQACPHCGRGAAAIIDTADPHANPLYARFMSTLAAAVARLGGHGG